MDVAQWKVHVLIHETWILSPVPQEKKIIPESSPLWKYQIALEESWLVIFWVNQQPKKF